MSNLSSNSLRVASPSATSSTSTSTGGAASSLDANSSSTSSISNSATSASTSTPSSSTTAPSSPCILPFELGNPTVELITGCMFLADAEPPPMRTQDEVEDEWYQEEECEQEEEDAATTKSSSAAIVKNQYSTCLVALFDIPAHLSLNELHEFLLDASDLLAVQLTRMPSRVRPDEPTYAAMLQFRTPDAATTFIREYDQIPYNSLEPERCLARFVVGVVFDEPDKYAFPAIHAATPIPTSSSSSSSVSMIPHLTLSKAHSRELNVASPKMRGASISSSALLNPSAVASSLMNMTSTRAPTPSHTPALGASSDPSSSGAATSNAPTCPVCLESILPSSASPMLTILCHHIFHFDCLARWVPSSTSSSCPVCRYMMQPNTHTQCSTCKATEKLWLCILCGHVGCSRYSKGHARTHFEETSHNYAIEVLTQRVWDYTADCYVHRLVRNKTDGKLVELTRVRTLDDDVVLEGCTPTKSLSGSSAGGESMQTHHSSSQQQSFLPSPAPQMIHPSSSAYASVKLEEFLLEYNYLLSSQLEQQRRIFQSTLDTYEKNMNERRERLEKERDTAKRRKIELERKVTSAIESESESTLKLQQHQTTHASLIAQSQQLSSLHAKLLSDSSSARASQLSSSRAYQTQQDAILAEQDRTISSLEEQIHDLQFFLDTQKKIDRMDEKSRKSGTKIGLKHKLQSGAAELQFVEVAPEDEKAKKKNAKKRG